MPLGFHRHSNRSKPELTDHTGLGSASPSTGGSVDDLEAIQARTNNQHQVLRTHADPQPYIHQGVQPDLDPRGSAVQVLSGDAPARSSSTRYSPRSYPSPGPPSQAGSSADDLALESRKLQHQGRRNTGGLQQQTQPPTVESKKEKKGFFGRIKGSSTKAAEQPPPSSHSNASGLSRRLSRKEHPRVQPPQHQQRDSLDHLPPGDWGSKAHLPSPLEGAEDDTGLDPYQIRDPGKEEIYNGQGQTRKQSIRPVRGDSDPPNHLTHEDVHQQYQVPQQQQRSSPEGAQQNRYPSSTPLQSQHGNSRPGSLITNEQVRQLQNPETTSQVSFESPVDQRDEQRPTSVQSNGQSPTQRQEYQDRPAALQAPPRSSPQQPTMPPPPALSQQRRPVDPKQGQADAREGTPGYQQTYRNQPTTPGIAPPPNYRGGPPQREQYGGGEQGRSTPPPGSTDNSDAFKELSQKYKKVKSLYFEKTAQVEQLQNTLANQRLSQSRTSLDDSEYMTRFQRLDGAITNLAFNIRKDWRTVPYWIAQSVNQDALKIGKQEMTAVGRACITKFLVEEVFNKSFHPALEPEMSTSLKVIERNIRRFSPALNNQEESDALTSKVIQWRLTTLEGLKDILQSPESEEHRKQFTQMATSNLSAHIINYLQEPAPPGIEDSAHMIVELAVSISANLPLESREISITYPMPGEAVLLSLMKLGEGVPPLENPGAETISEMDSKSSTSGGSGDKDDEKADPKSRKEKTKSGMLQAMMGSSSSSRKGSTSSPGGADDKGKEDAGQKVRFSGFVGIEVRGRQILGKAQVWTM